MPAQKYDLRPNQSPLVKQLNLFSQSTEGSTVIRFPSANWILFNFFTKLVNFLSMISLVISHPCFFPNRCLYPYNIEWMPWAIQKLMCRTVTATSHSQAVLVSAPHIEGLQIVLLLAFFSPLFFNWMVFEVVKIIINSIYFRVHWQSHYFVGGR